MTRAQRYANMAGVVLPFLGLIAAVVLLWNSWVDWIDLGIMAFTYVIYGLGVTVATTGCSPTRVKTYHSIEYGSAIAGSMGLQGGVLDSVADHRSTSAHRREGRPALPARRPRRGHQGPLARRHRVAVRDPRPGGLEEVRQGALRGPGDEDDQPALPALGGAQRRDPDLARLVLHGFTLEGALRGLVWGGLVRAFFLHHITSSINSICRYYGKRRFDVEDLSRNVFWSRSRRSARRGTTTTTRSRAPPTTD